MPEYAGYEEEGLPETMVNFAVGEVVPIPTLPPVVAR
jgi:hypothetical protein